MHHTTKQYLLPISFGTLLSLAAFLAILFYIDPFQTNVVTFILFFVTAFLWMAGFNIILGLIIRKRFFPGIFMTQFNISLRQGLLISTLITGLVLLETLNVLVWWMGLILILFIIAVEFFFGSN